MNPSIFESIKDEHLNKPLRILKLIGKGCLVSSFVGIVVIQLNQGNVGGTPLLDFATKVIGWGFILAMICFAILGLVTLGKTRDNTTAQAIGRALKVISIYMFLPALVVALVLALLFIL